MCAWREQVCGPPDFVNHSSRHGQSSHLRQPPLSAVHQARPGTMLLLWVATALVGGLPCLEKLCVCAVNSLNWWLGSAQPTANSAQPPFERLPPRDLLLLCSQLHSRQATVNSAGPPMSCSRAALPPAAPRVYRGGEHNNCALGAATELGDRLGASTPATAKQPAQREGGLVRIGNLLLLLGTKPELRGAFNGSSHGP